MKTTKLNVIARALADFNVVACSEDKLKPEQEVPVKSHLDGKDVLAVLPTGRFPVLQLVIRNFVALSNDFPNNDRYDTRSIPSTERLICQKCHQCYNSPLEIGVLSCFSR